MPHSGKRGLRALTAIMLTLALLLAPVSSTAQADDTPPPQNDDKEAAEMAPDSTLPTTTHMSYFESLVQAYVEKGFPRDYAAPLATLALVHPTWEFEPISVPEPWQDVLYYEVDENPARSLITKSEAYAAYRHPTNTALYDTGHYQASRDAVAYFMDARNFLNEADVFQFYCYAQDHEQADTLTAVEYVLRGSFMENTDAGDGKTYAQTFVHIGQELGISAIYLAVRALQEQGYAGGMTITGDGGQLLADWLAQGIKGAPDTTDEDLSIYDGYYNMFNIKASGTGSYTVLRGAMCRAMEGTPEMSEAWGGSPAWDTPAKSIYGGALYIRSSYFANGQNTAYLQKYNVAPESSRRFWGQYMQNIVAALSEGRSLYHAYRAAGALDLPAVFRIPVYVEQPDHCPDPADSTVEYTALSTHKYDVSAELTVCGQTLTLPQHYPVRLSSGELATISVTTTRKNGLALHGTLQSDGGITALWLTPVALQDAAYKGEPIVIYEREDGCDTLQLCCDFPLDTAATAGSRLTYLLSMQTGKDNRHASVLPVALLEIAVE